jgi:hypothetical protein
MEMDEPVAHVAEDGRIHPLDEHLWGTAERAVKSEKKLKLYLTNNFI